MLGAYQYYQRHAAITFLICLAALGSPFPLLAHKASDGYLSLRTEGTTLKGRLDLALKDVDFAIGLDADGDGSITWGELQAKQDALNAYVTNRVHISASGKTGALRITDLLVDYHNDGGYAVVPFEVLNLPASESLTIEYRVLFEHDALHRGLFQLEHGDDVQSSVFTPSDPTQQFVLKTPDLWHQVARFAQDGVWHIWTGYDHILFLIALLLPAVLLREAGGWSAVPAFRPAFLNVFKIVTAFTVAHSITLSLATLGVIHLPSRLVESAIAASVVLAAVNNVVPFFRGRTWLVAFCFGLIHGFGFANVLIDLGLPKKALAVSLVSFNLGVEAGQLAVVATFLPLAYLLRASWFYRHLTLRAGSTAIAGIAVMWMAERMLDVKWLPF